MRDLTQVAQHVILMVQNETQFSDKVFEFYEEYSHSDQFFEPVSKLMNRATVLENDTLLSVIKPVVFCNSTDDAIKENTRNNNMYTNLVVYAQVKTIMATTQQENIFCPVVMNKLHAILHHRGIMMDSNVEDISRYVMSIIPSYEDRRVLFAHMSDKYTQVADAEANVNPFYKHSLCMQMHDDITKGSSTEEEKDRLMGINPFALRHMYAEIARAIIYPEVTFLDIFP